MYLSNCNKNKQGTRTSTNTHLVLQVRRHTDRGDQRLDGARVTGIGERKQLEENIRRESTIGVNHHSVESIDSTCFSETHQHMFTLILDRLCIEMICSRNIRNRWFYS
jgi:hypothetical protein